MKSNDFLESVYENGVTIVKDFLFIYLLLSNSKKISKEMLRRKMIGYWQTFKGATSQPASVRSSLNNFALNCLHMNLKLKESVHRIFCLRGKLSLPYLALWNSGMDTRVYGYFDQFFTVPSRGFSKRRHLRTLFSEKQEIQLRDHHDSDPVTLENR